MVAVAKRKLNRTVLMTVASVTALVGLLSFGIIDTAYQDRISREALNLSFETESHIQSLFSLLQDAETGQRGFIITGDPSYLAPYQRAIDRLPSEITYLRSVADDADRTPLDEVERLSRLKLAELDRSIQVRRAEGLAAATDIVQSGAGNALMEDIRRTVVGMLSEDARDVQRDKATNDERAVAIRWTMLGLLLAIVAVSIVATIMVSRHFGKRVAMELVLRRHERHLDALRSIAEACNFSTDFASAAARTLAAFAEAVHANSGSAYRLQREKGSERIETLACWPPGSSADDRFEGAGFPIAASVEYDSAPAVQTDPTDPQAWRIVAPIRDEGRLAACLQWAGRGTDPYPEGVEALVSYTVQQISRVAERQRISDTLADVATRHKALFDSATDAILTMNESGSIESLNPAAERLFGYDAQAILRRHVGQLLPNHVETFKGSPALLAHGMPSGVGTVQEIWARRRDGTHFPVDVALSEMTISSRKLTTAFVRDISDRKRMEQMKTEFVSTVSHELRTPLTSISGSLGLLAGGAAGLLPSPAARLIHIAHKNSDRLVRLINDILDIEKIEAGQIGFNMRQLDLKPLLEATIDSNRAFADGFGVTMSFTGEEVSVRGDADRLMQVVTNLLSNAIKFSPRGGNVTVALTLVDGTAAITVRDQGPGIPDDFRARMFSKFAQADSSDIRQKGGTGLGLSIVRELVLRHDGRVSFESDAHWGTEFRVELPAARIKTSPPAQASARAPRAERVVMLYSTDPSTEQAVSRMMRSAGLTCETVNSADSARDALTKRLFGAILVDIGSLGSDGAGFLQGLPRADEVGVIPVLVIYANAPTNTNGLPSEALSVIDCRGAPIDMDRLLLAVRHALGITGQGNPLVLHVEDDPDVLQVVSASLASIAEVVSVQTLEEARTVLRDRPVDVVVLDLTLEHGSGLDLLPDLRTGNGASIPTIIFTAQNSDPALAGRVDAVLTKSQASLSELSVEVERLSSERAA